METDEERQPIKPDINPEIKPDQHTSPRCCCCPRVTVRFVPLMVVTFCFIISSVGTFIVLPQYILARLKREANFSSSYNSSEMSQCLVNKSDPLYQEEQRIQARSSSIFGTLSVYGGIPNVFTVLVQGVISDRVGRRAIIAVPIVGALVSNLGLALIIHFDLPLDLYNLFSFLNGVGGQQPAFQTGAFAYVADVTSPNQRGFVFALIEATLLLSNVGTNLVVGYLIKWWGFELPMWILSGIPVGTLLLLVCLPETLRRREETETGGRCRQIASTVKAQIGDMRRLLLINRRRSHYLLLLILGYMLYEMITTGAWVISTLYLLNKPFCWSPVQLGYYNAIRTTVWMVGGVVILALGRNRLSDDNMLLLAVVSCVATYALQGLASEVASPLCNVVMMTAATIGVMLTIGPVMLRAMCSKMVETTEQGAMLGLMSTGEAFAFAVCGAIFSGIYSASVAFHKGFTLYLCSGLLVLVGALFTYLRFVLPGVKRSLEMQQHSSKD